MAQLIDLTVTRRKSANKDDSFATPLTYGFDVEDIVVPVRNDGSDSYFTARQLKGTHPSSKSVGTTEYWVSESLAAIAAKSDLLVNLTVTKRRNVDVANEKYVFVTSRFSENIKVSDTGGSKFFYQEDGDVNLVEYEVSETIAQIVTQGNLPAGGFIELTYAQALDAAVKCKLVEGEHYKITDRADLGVILLATTPCSFSLEGQGIFLNPDFQNVLSLNTGVWHSGLAGLVANVSTTIWNGFHYLNLTGATGTAPNGDAVNWQLIPKSTTDYIEEIDFIQYDFANDWLIRREDKRGNKVRGYSDEFGDTAIDYFQWGNDAVTFNRIEGASTYECYNNRGILFNNYSYDTVNMVSSQANVGTVESSCFKGNTNVTCDFNTNKGLKYCEVRASASTIGSVVFDTTALYEKNKLDVGYSDFPANLDMTDGQAYALATTTLTVPTSLKYVGIFTLINNSGASTSKIVELPTNHKLRFYVAAGNTQIFSHTAIAGAVADQLISDAAAANTITGRTNGSDFIEYERAGNLNRRYNAVISA